MTFIDKFQNKLRCNYNTLVIFEIIGGVECDWGSHVVIQCPSCEELFSIDNQCPAFQSILKLVNNNTGLYSKKEIDSYLYSSHPN